MAQLDLAKTGTQVVVGMIAGGGQRMAWETSETIGLVATGAAGLAGVVLPMFMRGGGMLLSQASDALVVSASSIGGWVAAEKLFIEGATAVRTGHLPAQQRLSSGYAPARQSVYGGRSNSVVHRAMIPVNDGDVTVL